MKHLTALVEEAARKNRSLIAIGSKLFVVSPFLFRSFEWIVLQCGVFVAEAHEKMTADARAGYVKGRC